MGPELVEQLLDWVRSRYFGKYRGVVTDNADETKRGRVKVRVPAVLGAVEVWAMPCVPYAGKQVGFYAIPDAGAGVWVEFEAGDPSFPIWTGCFWGADELPDTSDPKLKIWRTSTVTVRIDDNAKELRIESTDGGKLTVADEVVGEAGSSTHAVKSGSIVAENGSARLEIGSGAVDANRGGLVVR